MHVLDTERLQLVTYKLKNVAKTWFDQLNDSRDKDAPHPRLSCFEEALLGRYFPYEIKEGLKQDSLSVHEYFLKFTQWSSYFNQSPKYHYQFLVMCFWLTNEVTGLMDHMNSISSLTQICLLSSSLMTYYSIERMKKIMLVSCAQSFRL